MARYQYQHFGYAPPPEVSGKAAPARYPVVIVGAGPTGLSMAIDLALRGVASVVLDDNDVVSVGSRAIRLASSVRAWAASSQLDHAKSLPARSTTVRRSRWTRSPTASTSS